MNKNVTYHASLTEIRDAVKHRNTMPRTSQPLPAKAMVQRRQNQVNQLSSKLYGTGGTHRLPTQPKRMRLYYLNVSFRVWVTDKALPQTYVVQPFIHMTFFVH